MLYKDVTRSPGLPYFKTVEMDEATLEICEVPVGPSSTIGGTLVVTGKMCLLLVPTTAMATPPPSIAPAVKSAAWIIVELGIE